MTAVVAVGQALGALGGETEAVRTLRIGDEYVDLDSAEYELWQSAHRAADSADPALERLVERGCLVRIDPGRDLRGQFAAHRLIAQGFGRGNTGDRPGQFVVSGLHGGPRVELDAWTYSVWVTSWRASLWEACAGTADEVGVSTDDVARQVAERLVALVGSRVALLDRLP